MGAASRMLGASPAKTFFLVVVPVMRTPILSAVIMVFVLVGVIVYGAIARFGDLPKLLGARSARD